MSRELEDMMHERRETAKNAVLGDTEARFEGVKYGVAGEVVEVPKGIDPRNYNVKVPNPKDAVGIKKPPMSTVPIPVLIEIGLGMMEGALKYGRHNWRESSARASVLYDATLRHLFAWFEGEDMDPDTDNTVSHVTKAICSLVVLRDAMIQGKMVDDRAPRVGKQADKTFYHRYNKHAETIAAKYGNVNPKHYTIKDEL